MAAVKVTNYVAECQYCFKRGGVKGTTYGVPNGTPTISGKCPASPNGKHIAKWVLK